MAFSRNSLVAAVAGTLSLAMLTGCPGPTQTPGTGTPTTAPGATTAPTTAPGGDASPAAPASQAPGASVAPSTTPSATPLQPTTLRGKVYDLDNAVVNTGAKVTVKSLNPSSPFESTVDVIQGSYVVNNVPAGVQLEITTSRTGWTSRTRVETLLPLTSTQPNVVNFGGEDSQDTEGEAYFISKYPEISAVEPAEDAENVDPTKLVVKLTLSEPLDATNQRRFANAVRVWPANDEAGGVDGLVANGGDDLEDNTLASNVSFAVETATGNASDVAYVIKQGSIFSDDDNSRATVTWDAAGQVATLTFNAPLQTGESDPGKYNVGLVGTSGDPIKDGENNLLGTDDNGALNDQQDAGELIRNVFREPDLSAGDATTAAGRWAETHDDVSTFELAEDNTDPTLQSVNVVEVAGETRIQLTFSEPMGVYAGSGVVATDASVAISNLGNFTFAVAETAEDLADVDLDGDAVATVDGSTAATFTGAEEVEFAFDSVDGIEISNTDPKTIRLIVAENFFGDNLNAIKARVEAVADPAGNAITESQADSQVKTGTI